MLINFEKIKIKMKRDLDIKNNFYDKYYLINSEWFNKYLELNNITEVYNYILSNGIIENIINNNQIIEKETIINQVLSKLNSDMINKIKSDNNYENLKNNNLFQLKKANIKANEKKIITLYSNFILLKEESIKYFYEELKLNFEKKYFLVILGEKKIFIKINNAQYSLEIGHLNQINIFIFDMMLNYINESELNNNIFSLIKNSYKQYCEKFMKNENNSISIFNKSNSIIGHAYKLNKPKITSKKCLVNEDLNILINYYFLNYQFDCDSNKIFENKFYLLNELFIHQYKKFWDYDSLQIELDKINLMNQIKNEFKNDIKKNISNENIIEITKNLPLEINNSFNKKTSNDKYINNIPIEPNIHIFIFNSTNYFYYNDLIILNESIYNYLTFLHLRENKAHICSYSDKSKTVNIFVIGCFFIKCLALCQNH